MAGGGARLPAPLRALRPVPLHHGVAHALALHVAPGVLELGRGRSRGRCSQASSAPSAAGTADDALGDGLAVTDALGDRLPTLTDGDGDGDGLTGGASCASHAPNNNNPASPADSATAATGIPFERRPMRPFPAAPRRPALKR